MIKCKVVFKINLKKSVLEIPYESEGLSKDLAIQRCWEKMGKEMFSRDIMADANSVQIKSIQLTT